MTTYEHDLDPAEREAEILPFERWAEISARLTGLDQDERARILDALHIDPEDHHASEVYWGSVLVEDVARGDMARARHYGGRCAREIERRAPARGRSPALDMSSTQELPAFVDLRPALPFRAPLPVSFDGIRRSG